MNSDILEGRWKEVKGKIQQKWGKLSDDEMDQIAGKREELIGRIQQHYGHGREEARREVEEYLNRL